MSSLPRQYLVVRRFPGWVVKDHVRGPLFFWGERRAWAFAHRAERAFEDGRTAWRDRDRQTVSLPDTGFDELDDRR